MSPELCCGSSHRLTLFEIEHDGRGRVHVRDDDHA